MILEEFSISNSNLAVAKLSVEFDSSIGEAVVNLEGGIKEQMRYQVLALYSTTSEGCSPLITAGLTKRRLYGIGLNKVIGVYTLVKRSGKVGQIQYTPDQVKTILRVLATLPHDALDVREQLILATGDQELIDLFYDSYGGDQWDGWLKEIADRLVDPGYNPGTQATPVTQARTYKSGRRYSVYRLIHDLANDPGSKILISPDLIGKYQRITASKTVKPADTTYLTDDWCQVVGYQGNKTRANLSIQYQSKVVVDVPQNPHGVEAGPRELKCIRSMSLIKDGRLHVQSIGVMVSEGLARRLRGTGAVTDGNLIYKGALLLDLTKMPVISKSEIRPCPDWFLADLELRLATASLALDYIGVVKGTKQMPGSKPVYTPAEQFLRDLGIYGDEYIPKRETPVREGTQYSVREVMAKITGLENDSLKVWKYFSDKVRSTKYSPRVNNRKGLDAIISLVGQTPGTIDEQEKYWTEKKKELSALLRDKKFQMIMSKRVPSEDKKSHVKGDPTAQVVVGWKIKGGVIKV